MKKLLLAIVVLSTLSLTTNAQVNARWGVKAGFNLSHTNMTGINSMNPGAYAGGLMELSFPAGSKWKAQAEALFNWRNFGFKDIDGSFNMYQISVPLMAEYFFTPRFDVAAGVSLNPNLSAKTNSDLGSQKIDLNSFQIGGLVGASYYIKNGLSVDLRYNYYFGDALKNGGDSQIGTIQLGLGYKF